MFKQLDRIGRHYNKYDNDDNNVILVIRQCVVFVLSSKSTGSLDVQRLLFAYSYVLDISGVEHKVAEKCLGPE